MKNLFLLFSLTLLICSNNYQTYAQSYTLEEIRKNSGNSLNLAIDLNMDFELVWQSFKGMTQQEIESKLTGEKLNWHEASFGVYYLGSSYLMNEDFKNALECYIDAAENYINPMALVKIARINFIPKDELPSYISKLKSFEPDIEIAYLSINKAMESANFIIKKQKDDTAQYIIELVVANGLGLLDTFNTPSVKEQFNIKKADKKLKNAIKQMEEKYQIIYKKNKQ